MIRQALANTIGVVVGIYWLGAVVFAAGWVLFHFFTQPLVIIIVLVTLLLVWLGAET